MDATLPSWVQELAQRGVAEKKARQLALDVPESQPVLDQIEYAGHLLHLDSRSRKKISNPAGFLIWAIESNLCVPESFETSRKRKVRQANQEHENQEQLRQMQLELDYEEYCQRQILNQMKAEYTGEHLAEAVRAQMKIIRKEQPEWYQRVTEEIRHEVAIGRLHRIVRENLKLPTLERWSKQESQRRLF